MAHIVSLRILHEYLQDDCLWFEADGDEEMSGGDIIPYELDIPGPAPGIAIDRGTGGVHSIVLEQASTELGPALVTLGMNLLPWRFSLPELDITDSTLEEVLLTAGKLLGGNTKKG